MPGESLAVRPISRTVVVHIAHTPRPVAAVPPRTLVDGTNTLAIFPQDKTNSIIVSQIEIIPQRMRDLLKLAHVVLNVTDLSGRFPIPARVTIANAENNHNLAAGDLFVAEAIANEGPHTIKRWQPRAQGRAFPIHKPMTHITIVVADREA